MPECFHDRFEQSSADTAATGTGNDQILSFVQPQLTSDSFTGAWRALLRDKPGVDNRNLNVVEAKKGLLKSNQLRIGVHQDRIEILIQRFQRAVFMSALIFLFYQNIAHAADHFARCCPIFRNGFENRIELKTKRFAPKGIELNQENIRLFSFKKGQQCLFALFFDLIDG